MDRQLPEDFDALAPDTFDSPYETYARLRQTCPVAHSRAWGGFWALTRYEDVARAAADPATYTTTVQNVVPKLAYTGRRPPLHLDPPEHTPYRAAIDAVMRPARIAALEPAVRRLTVDLLDPLIASGAGDICADFSSHLPVRVFAEWMNLPSGMVEVLREAGRAFNIAVQSADDPLVTRTSLRLYELARELLALRKAAPQDPLNDPTSALLVARHDGAPLPDDMIVGTVRQVLVVGIIAPTVVIGSFAVHLSRHPQLQQELRENPGAIPAAVDELLRLYTPYRGFARTATREIELHGRRILPGEPIALVYASANRDESVFPEADQFCMHRPNIRHSLAFGRVPHRCAGAALALLELRVALEELLAGTAHFELDGPITPTRCPEIGALGVPLKLVPRSAR